MMCPPFCFHAGSLAHCRPPSLAILRRVSRSCSKKSFHVSESAEHEVLWASCQRCGVTARAISCSPFAGKSAFPRATTVGNVTASFDQTQRRFCCVTSVSARHGGAWVWLPDSSATLSRNRRAYTFPHEYDTGRTISRAATPVPGR